MQREKENTKDEKSGEIITGKQKIRKWFKRIIFSLLILTFTIELLLYFFATPVLKNYIQNKVFEKTHGLYRADFEKISFELTRRQIKLLNFSLTPDTSVYRKLVQQGIEHSAIYDISLHSLEIQGTSFYKLIFKQKLKVKKLLIDNPVIKLKKLPDEKNINIENRDFFHTDLYPSIKKYVDVLEINYLDIKNGQFHLRLASDNKNRTSHYGLVSIKLFDFYLDENAFKNREKLFYSNDIQIFITNYRIRLSDGVHNFFAENIYISTKESILKAKAVNVLPAHDLRRFKENQIADNFYFASPEITFRNFDIKSLYFNQNIEIQNIIIESPKVKFIDKRGKQFIVSDKNDKKDKKVSETKSLEKIPDLYKLIKNRLNSVLIKTLDFNHAEFYYYHHSPLEKPVFRIKDFNLSLLNFLLDNKSGKDKSRILYSKNIRLNLNDFKAKIIDQSHNLTAKTIHIHTDTKSLYIKNLDIHPAKNTGKLSQKINLNVKDLRLSGTDFYRLLMRKELIINQMVLGRSNIDIKIFEKKQQSPSDFMDKLTDAFLKKLRINYFHLKTSGFNIRKFYQDSIQTAYSGKIDLNIRYFNFYKGGNQLAKMFSLYGFKIKLSDYTQQISDRVHLLKAQNVFISNNDSVLEIKNMEIHPKVHTYKQLKLYKQADIMDLSIPEIAVKGIAVNQIFTQKSLRINEINVNKPGFSAWNFPDIKTLQDSLSGFETNNETDSLPNDSVIIPKNLNGILSKHFKNLSINKLKITDGKFVQYKTDSNDISQPLLSGKISLNVEEFNYDFYADSLNYGITDTRNLIMQIDDFYKRTKNEVYELKIKNINLSKKDSTLSAKIVRFFPDKNAQDSIFGKYIITAYSPEITFKGIDLTSFANTGTLNLGIFSLIDPSVSMLKNPFYTNKKAIPKLKQKIPFEKIITDSIIITRGSLGILNDKTGIDNKQLSTDFNIYLSKLVIDSNFVENPASTLKNTPAKVHLSNFKYQTPDDKLTFDFNNFYFDSERKIILMDNLLYYADKNKTKNNLFEAVFVPAIQLSNFSYGGLLANKLIADSLEIIQPYLVIINDKEKKSQKEKINPLQINLYEKTKKIFKKIDLKSINIEAAGVKIKNIGNINQPFNDYDKIYCSVSNLLIDSLHQNDRKKIFNTSDISISKKDYTFTINKGFYKIDIGEIGFSTGKQKAFIKAFSLNPVQSREEITANAKYEVKLLYINVPEIIINKPDFNAYAAENKIIAQSIDINRMKLHSFKDKHFPIDSIEKSPMPLKDLQKFKTYIKIDTVNIKDFYVGVEMLGENSSHSGYFDITNINGYITNLTNDKKLIDTGLVTKIKAYGKIMDEAELKASFRIPLNSETGEYYYGGKLSGMRMSAFNPLLENLYFVSIRDGYIDSLEFTVSANDDYDEGYMKFVYHGLKFDLHNKRKTDSLIVNKRGFVSMLANSIVKNDNPRRKGGRIKPARIYFERNIYRPIFNYWTLSLLNGIKTTMGFKSKELKERLKWEKIYEKNKRIFKKKEKKINRKQKRKNRKEIDKELKADMRKEEKEKKNQNNKPDK